MGRCAWCGEDGAEIQRKDIQNPKNYYHCECLAFLRMAWKALKIKPKET